MSHRAGHRDLWHGHCSHTSTAGRKWPWKVEPENSEIQRKSGFGTRDAKPDTKRSDNNNKTLLHRQASDRTPGPKKSGRFFWRASHAKGTSFSDNGACECDVNATAARAR